MKDTKRKESGASEVIGAVLLVSLVVIGGAVVAAFVFGQPTPKEVPHVNFGVSLDGSILTLHHTGGDTLLPGMDGVTWYDTDGILHQVDPADTDITWSSDGDLPIHNVDKRVGNVILSYKDNVGGETVLRRVPFEDDTSTPVITTPTPTPGPFTISGFKRSITGEYTGPAVTITLYRKEGNLWVPAGTTPTGIGGYYSFTVEPEEAWYYLEEAVPLGWRAVDPADGSLDEFHITPSNNHNFQDLLNFTNEPIPTPTQTVTITPTVTITLTPTPTPPSISGHKYRVDENGTTLDPATIRGVTIILERWTNTKNKKWEWVEVTRTTTDASGYYYFSNPTDGATYRLREDLDSMPLFTVYSPTGGIISGVLPGATDQDFKNTPVSYVGDGVVMYLNKTVEDNHNGLDDDGGYVVDGTYLQGDARGGDFVTINGYTYEFKNNEAFRFTIVGNQTSGELKVDKHDLTSLTFNVMFQVYSSSKKEWVTPEDMGSDPVIGKPTEVMIEQINKNNLNVESTLTYRFDQYVPTETLLRLNGKVVIDSPADDTYLDFSTLHIVHDNRYHEGLNTMWIILEPGYDYILVQGISVSP